MFRIRVLALSACVSVACGAAQGQVDPDAKRVLEASAEVVRDLDSMMYRGHSYGGGAMKGLFDYEGEVRLLRSGQGRNRALQWFRGAGEFNNEPGDEFLVATDGSVTTWVDAFEKKVYHRPNRDRNAQGELKKAQQLLIEDFISRDPYRMMLESDNISRGDPVQLDGEICDVVTVKVQERIFEWAISTLDRLPRRFVRRFGEGNQGFSLVLDLTNVDVSVPLAAKDVTIQPPDGFVVDGNPPRPPTPQPQDRRPDQSQQDRGADARPLQPAQPPEIDRNADRPELARLQGAPKPGMDAVNFELVSGDGRTVKFREAAKGKVAVIDFWASYNGPSKRTLDIMEEIRFGFRDDPVVFFGLSCFDGPGGDRAKKVFADKDLGFDLLLNAEETLETYGFSGCPAVVVVGADGTIIDAHQGYPGKDDYRNLVVAAINQGLDAIGN